VTEPGWHGHVLVAMSAGRRHGHEDVTMPPDEQRVTNDYGFAGAAAGSLAFFSPPALADFSSARRR
jgi:hypothetical protein